MQDDDEEDDEATAMAMANRQSVIKFNVREEEEDDLEREVSLGLIKISDLCFLSLLLHYFVKIGMFASLITEFYFYYY